jgi:hypothetical protein
MLEEEEACDKPKKTTIDAEYSPRSNDETLDEESHCRNHRGH